MAASLPQMTASCLPRQQGSDHVGLGASGMGAGFMPTLEETPFSFYLEKKIHP